MIIFKTLKWKNFLSTGDYWSSVDFTDSKTTIISGTNGAGKSTMLDALFFSLFGKTHRGITKPQIPNSSTEKNCMVEVEFETYGSNFKIIRGLKPTIFEIWKDGVLISQSSHSKEYQSFLEQSILKMSFKSFSQIVVLGSSNFIPFMRLTPQNRRDVIEELLDINVFSKMNTILKEKNADLKAQIVDNDHQQTVCDTKIEAQKKYIKNITEINQGHKDSKMSEIGDCEADILLLNIITDKMKTEYDTTWNTASADKKKIDKEIASTHRAIAKLDVEINNISQSLETYLNSDVCDACGQEISQETKDKKINDSNTEMTALHAEKSKLTDHHDNTLLISQESNSQVLSRCNMLTSTISHNESNVKTLKSRINKLKKEVKSLEQTGDVVSAQDELDQLITSGETIVSNRFGLDETKTYNDAIALMLKDTGIKTKIVKQYLPVMNNLVNKFLHTLDFYVLFELDESFNETIKSRFRDGFSYASFSEGEKQRIDLALLFTWRQIAKMKNSVATNLLILDETFDSSLDLEGVDNLMKIIYGLDDNTSVFVISHKNVDLENRFESAIKVYKDTSGFSRLNHRK